jgi:hypothetical protein
MTIKQGVFELLLQQSYSSWTLAIRPCEGFSTRRDRIQIQLELLKGSCSKWHDLGLPVPTMHDIGLEEDVGVSPEASQCQCETMQALQPAHKSR